MISGAYPPIKSGIADYVQILSEKLIELGVDLTIITSRHQSIKERSHVRPVISGWNASALIGLLKVLKDADPSVVHIQYPSFGYGRYLAINLLPLLMRLFLSQSRTVVTQHEFSVYSIAGKLRSSIHLLFSHAITTTTTRNLHQMLRLLPLIRRRAVYLPIGSNIKVTSREAAKKNLLMVSYFGIVRPGKGIEDVIRALSRIRDREFRFLLVGEVNKKNAYHRKILRLLRENQLLDHTQITGYCSEEEVSRSLSSSDICVLPFSDGASERRGTLLAALQHAAAVITTRGNPRPEGLVDGENVKFVGRNSVEELTSAIRLLMDDEDLRKKIARAGREWGRQFSWDDVVHRTLSLYLKLLGSGES